MAITVRGSNWAPFTALVRQMDTDFDTLMRRAFGSGRAGFVPAADVTKDGTDVVVTLELPGVDIEKDVDVEVHDGRLVITGRRSAEESSESGGMLVREIRSGEFRREFALPKGTTADAVEADYESGLLKVRVHDVIRPAVAPAKVKVRQLDAGSEEQIPEQSKPAES